MSKSYWRGSIAFVVFGILLAAIAGTLIWDISATLTEQRMRNDQAASANTNQTADRVEKNCGADLGPSALRSCIREEIVASEESHYTQRDLDAQEVMARFTRVMGYTGLVGLVVGLWSVYLIWATLRETQRMASITRAIGEAQVRAYPAVLDVEGSIDKHNRPAVALRVANSGQSPAKQVHVTITCSFLPFVLPGIPFGWERLPDPPKGKIRRSISSKPLVALPFDVAGNSEERVSLRFEALDQEFVADLGVGVSTFFVDVRLDFIDVFGRRHREELSMLAQSQPNTGWLQQMRLIPSVSVKQKPD